MTPQDIRDKRFEKAIFGGYDCGSTDNFLDAVAAELAATLKENSILKSKMKILADKIEEYRSTEEAMKLALLSAQKLGVQIQDEAKENSAKILAEAREKAKTVADELRRNIMDEELKLSEARESSARYIENMRVTCEKQLDFLETLALGEIKISDSATRANTAYESSPETERYYASPETEPAPPVDNPSETEEFAESTPDDDEPLIDFNSVVPGLPDSDGPTKFYKFNFEPEKASMPTRFSFETLTFEEFEESV